MKKNNNQLLMTLLKGRTFIVLILLVIFFSFASSSFLHLHRMLCSFAPNSASRLSCDTILDLGESEVLENLCPLLFPVPDMILGML